MNNTNLDRNKGLAKSNANILQVLLIDSRNDQSAPDFNQALKSALGTSIEAHK
jgi:hypothetical protein